MSAQKENEILIRVHAFGLNRSEMFTRKGLSPPSIVKFPRILGIEAVGRVVAAPGNETNFPAGAVVATAMGGMGRTFDGGYAEYTCVPANQVRLIFEITSFPFQLLDAYSSRSKSSKIVLHFLGPSSVLFQK